MMAQGTVTHQAMGMPIVPANSLPPPINAAKGRARDGTTAETTPNAAKPFKKLT